MIDISLNDVKCHPISLGQKVRAVQPLFIKTCLRLRKTLPANRSGRMYSFLIYQTLDAPPAPGEPALAICYADIAGLRIVDYGVEALRPWSEVHSIHALARTPLLDASLALRVTFTDGRTALVSDDEAQWYTLALTLPGRLSGVPNYAEWTMRLRADPQQVLQLF